MDQAAAQIAMKTSGGRCATVSIENVDFIAPVPVGSEVSIYGELEDVGRSSMQIRIEVWITEQDAESYKSTETRFVFVAIDSTQKSSQSELSLRFFLCFKILIGKTPSSSLSGEAKTYGGGEGDPSP